MYRDEGFFVFLKSWTGHAVLFNMSDVDRASPSRSSQLWLPRLSLHFLTFLSLCFTGLVLNGKEMFFPTLCWVSTFNGLFESIHINLFTGLNTKGLPRVFYLSIVFFYIILISLFPPFLFSNEFCLLSCILIPFFLSMYLLWWRTCSNLLPKFSNSSVCFLVAGFGELLIHSEYKSYIRYVIYIFSQ